MSKGLEALDYIKCCGLYATRDERKRLQFVHIKDIRPKDLDIIEKELDILELIKTKKVNVYDEIYGNETYEEYMYFKIDRPTNLTEKEWELLKGWLENEKKR